MKAPLPPLRSPSLTSLPHHRSPWCPGGAEGEQGADAVPSWVTDRVLGEEPLTLRHSQVYFFF